MYPWKDYSGRTSPLKLAIFIALFGPGLWTALSFAMGWLQPQPYTAAIREIGLWTIRLIFIALAITPLRGVLQWSRLILVRRMIGVAAFAYALTHLSLYTADQMFDLAKVVSEIVQRIYLTIGFAAVIGLSALAATSTDGMIRRLGLLAVVHYCMQSKLDLWEPSIMAGIYFWLMGYRLLVKYRGVRGRLPLVWLGGLGVMAAVASALGETAYFWIAFGVDPMRVIAANWSLVTGVRPAVIVLGLALAVTAAAALRALIALPGKRRPGFA